ncbi:Flap-structured DNA-binding and RNA-binding protein [Entomortierella beljakovae]|nr:Flap-structured DNA-binding and RNA-binding protein [Entomortierella beljakovae]
MARRPVSESFTMLSEQGKQSFDPAVSFRQSDYSPTLLQQQQQQQQQQHFASGIQQKQQQQPTQHFHRTARPASEILPQNHHHPFLANNNFQSPEAEAIDKWFEDLSHYEQTLEEMAVVSLDTVFKDELSTIESWFRVLSEAERTAALYSLLQHSSQVQIRFFITVLQQMAKKDPVGALLSPSQNDKDPVHSQLHGAMAKAEMEASQRLLNVLPIQPPAPIERPGAHRRLYDRHSVTIGESDEYTRLFRGRDGKRNSIDFLGRSNGSVNNGNGSGGSNTNTSPNSNGNTNGHVNGVIGSGALSESISARVNQFKPTQGSLNRISNPNMFGNRPKSVHEGDASSMFSPNWNFATLGANPIHSNNGVGNVSPSSGHMPSPGHIGDRTSFGRPKSVGGAEWMLSGSSNHRIPVTEGLEKPWTPLVMSPPNMGGFHNGTNGSGHKLSAGNFPNSGLAVERPKSVTEADLNISQWVHNNNLNNSNIANGTAGQRTSTLEELKANNRRRTLLRPSAIISNVPVTVMEGDEKLLSASANTSSINIVSTMFNETSGAGSGSGSLSDLAGSGVANSAASQGNAPGFSYGGSQPSLNTFSQQQQQAVQQLQNLTLDPNVNVRNSLQQQQQQQQQQQIQPQPRSRASSPFASPLPSPIKSGFRSRPVSGSTSPRLTAQNPGWTNGANNISNLNINNMNHVGSSEGSAIIPTDYNQKRHLSPSNLQRPHHHHSSLDDDYLSDTSDISSIGMHSHHGRGGSSAKEKKQPEGVDFDLLQDTPAWLRSLRLHKYNNIFEGMQWRDIVNLSDGDLINKGVAALGARRKMLKVFEQVRKEMLLQIAGCVPIDKQGRRVLLVASSKHDGEWVLPKGGWENDETKEDAAARETWEEEAKAIVSKKVMRKALEQCSLARG